MDLVHLPAARKRSLETLSHSALSVAHLLTHRPDAAVVFNAANAPLLPGLRAARIPVATHVDGLEWKRAKWGPIGQRYYRAAESMAVRWSDALIADAVGIADYYRAEFGAPTTLLTYGAPLIEPGSDRLAELGLTPGGYHLAVARFEPENHVDVIVEGYTRSAATKPLVVVGSAPYSDSYTARVHAAADGRVRFLGGVWDQVQLDQLYANCFTSLHGHSVGGTNPSLLRAIGAGTAVVAYDVDFNREVVADAGRFFVSPADVAAEVDAAEAQPRRVRAAGMRSRELARKYDWDDVAAGYEELALQLAGRAFPTRRPSGRRLPSVLPAPLRLPTPRPAAGSGAANEAAVLPFPAAQQ
jgi:glycosyltransferase involved in cell wall biosynthesis